MRIALLGAGRMATELGRHLLAGGHGVTVFNRTAGRTAALVDAGARAVGTAAEAVAGVDVVLTVLSGPQAVRDTLINPNLLVPGDLWLDVTTVGPEDATFHASWAEHKQVRYVAAPLLGSPGRARTGELTALVGGAAADLAAIRELTASWTIRGGVHELDSARAAAAGKLVATVALSVAVQGISEALTYAGDVGLDRDTALTVLGASALAPVVEAKAHGLREQDFGAAELTASALIEDLDLVLDAALGLHAVRAARDALETAIDDGRGEEDFSVLTDV